MRATPHFTTAKLFTAGHPNQSDRSRLGLIVVYRGAHTTIDEAAQAEYHKALAMTPQNA